MEVSSRILELRKKLALSQAEFAQKLFVTRQAVSRWERGETVPTIDTLKLIAETFHVSVDELLGQPAGQCQSCGMILARESDHGTERGGRSAEYCAACYQQGAFTREVTMEEMAELNLRDLDEWNRSMGLQLTQEEARAGLLEFLPTLKRWRTQFRE